MAEDLAAVANKLADVGRLLDGSSLRQITTRVATKSKTAMVPAISPNTLSHWGRGGKTVKARFEVTSDHTAEIVPTVAPLAALLEKGSGTSWKAPKRRGSARRRRGSVGRYTRGKVPARRVWSKARPTVERVAPGFVHDEVSQVLGRVF